MSEEKAKESERSPSPLRLQGDGRREGGIRAGPGVHPRVEDGGVSHSPAEMPAEGLRGAAAEGVDPRSQEVQLFSHKENRVSRRRAPSPSLAWPCASSAPGLSLRCRGA